jgi:hypothetical protein
VSTYRVVEQIGDVTFAVPGHEYPTFDLALLSAIDLIIASDEERELFVDGPNLPSPHPVSPQFRR